MFKVNLEALRSEMQGDLNRCNIHLLREQGAKLGVSSVTTYKKNELINLIIDKKLSNHRSYEVDKIPEYNSEVSILDKERLMEAYRSGQEEGEMISGILELNGDVDGFLRIAESQRSKEDAFVPQGIINEYKLKYGDQLVAKAMNLESQIFKGVFKIMSVNDQKSGGYIRKDFTRHVSSLSRTKVNLYDQEDDLLQMIDAFSPLGRGHRSVIFSRQNYNQTQLLCKVIHALRVHDIKTTALFLSERPENMSYIKRNAGENIIMTGCEAPYEENERIAQLALEKLKREAEIGRHVALVLSDITSLYARSSREVLGKKFNYKTLFGSGRSFERGGSLTVVTFARLMGNIGDDIYETLLPMANSVSVLGDSGDFLFDKPVYDYYDSFSDYFVNHEDAKRLLDIMREYIRKNEGAAQHDILKLYRSLL